jgi:hypothetical protein
MLVRPDFSTQGSRRPPEANLPYPPAETEPYLIGGGSGVAALCEYVCCARGPAVRAERDMMPTEGYLGPSAKAEGMAFRPRRGLP